MFRVFFFWVSKIKWFLQSLHYAIGYEYRATLSVFQSEVRTEPIVIRSHSFSRASRQLHVITSSFDWFTVFSVSSLIGLSDYFGFDFKTALKVNTSTSSLIQS